MTNPTRFPPEVARKLKTYVYRLIDPIDGRTFYVGKGKGNRVFAHARAEQGLDGDHLRNRLERIRRIRLAGLEVGHVIHRHGMDDETAFEVEAALIDAYPGLDNEVSGFGVSDVGSAHANQLIRRYSAEAAVFRHRVLLISINRTAAELDLYEATRFAWKVSRRRAEQAEVVLPTVQGIIVGAYVVDRWLKATTDNFPGRPDLPGRLGFVGEPAPSEVKDLYVNKRVPDKYRKRGAANPIRYTWT